MSIEKDLLEALMCPAGLIEPASTRLVWANPALGRTLFELDLDQNLNLSTLMPDLSPERLKDCGKNPVRENIKLPSQRGKSLEGRCQIGPEVELGGDKLLIVQLIVDQANTSTQATLNIFSRHMNAQSSNWKAEREALLEQIDALQKKIEA